ncbi:MAG: zf-HC2 domain-containing protein [Clostridia bacterium]|nr:zf-HC2 domain-containing protein [Clostridia bacterium]
MKSCEEYQALIEMYLDSELTREQKHLFETHISSCNECSEALSFAKSIRQTLKTLPEIDVPEDFNTILRQRINTECKAQKKTFTVYARKYCALAACVILAVVIGGGLSEFDFTKSGKEYDTFVTEGTPVPTLVPEIASIVHEQNAGEEFTPTKDKIIATPTPKINREIKPSVPSPTPADVATEASVVSTDTVSVNDDQEAHSPSMTALDPTEVITSPTPEAQASGVEDESSARAYESLITPTVTLTVSAEHTMAAVTLAEEFATIENGIYTTDKTSFNKLLEAFAIGGISYTTSGTVETDIFTFIIYTE